MYLVAAVTSSRFLDTVAITCTGNRCFADSVPEGNGIYRGRRDLDRDFVDVDSDGAVEVMTAECFDGCSGLFANPVYIFSIYKFLDNRGFVDWSAKAAPQYQKQLAQRIEEQRQA